MLLSRLSVPYLHSARATLDRCSAAVTHRSQLVGRKVTFTYDQACGRQLIVLQEFSNEPQQHDGSLASGSCVMGTMDTLARTHTSPRGAQVTQCNLDEIELTDTQREAMLKKLSRQMGRGVTFVCIVKPLPKQSDLSAAKSNVRLLKIKQVC